MQSRCTNTTHLKCWDQYTMATILHIHFQVKYFWVRIIVFWLKFHWSLFLMIPLTVSRDHFVNAPCQWETTLHCNVISHWLGTFTKRSLNKSAMLELMAWQWTGNKPSPNIMMPPGITWPQLVKIYMFCFSLYLLNYLGVQLKSCHLWKI